MKKKPIIEFDERFPEPLNLGAAQQLYDELSSAIRQIEMQLSQQGRAQNALWRDRALQARWIKFEQRLLLERWLEAHGQPPRQAFFRELEEYSARAFPATPHLRVANLTATDITLQLVSDNTVPGPVDEVIVVPWSALDQALAAAANNSIFEETQ